VVEKNEALALWLAPLVSTFPLVPLFSIPSSRLFLGRLMDDPAHPANQAWVAAAAVLFDGSLMAYFFALLLVLPVYLAWRRAGSVPVMRVLILFSFAGICASQLVHLVQTFRQPDLAAFASSWLSPVIGCACGLVAGAFFWWFAKRSWSRVLYALPPAVLVGCAIFLVAE
jgi:hypothetical protein